MRVSNDTRNTCNIHGSWRSTKEWDWQIFFSNGEANSRGVATLIPKELLQSFEWIEIKNDNSGRFLLISFKICEVELILINIYSQTKDNPSGQNNFFDYLYEVIDTYSDKNIIIGGDFNTYLNNVLDKKGGRTERQSPSSENTNNLCSEFSLVDIWRIRNPTTSKFTRIERSRNGVVQSLLN